MQIAAEDYVMDLVPQNRGMKWAGYIIGFLPVLMLVFSASMKFIKPDGFEESLRHLGWTEDQMFTLAFIEIGCTLLYLIPRTSILGALLLTAYLGGASATHVRVGDPIYVPVLLGVMIWLGLFLRDSRVRQLLPIKQ